MSVVLHRVINHLVAKILANSTGEIRDPQAGQLRDRLAPLPLSGEGVPTEIREVPTVLVVVEVGAEIPLLLEGPSPLQVRGLLDPHTPLTDVSG